MFSVLEIDSKIKLKKVDELLALPVVVRVNKFTEDAVKQFILEMAAASNTDQPVIPIVIDSYGGEVYSLLAMIDIIKSSKIPVATIGIGKHMSCGAILMSCGAEGMRFMSQNSTLMIHDVSSGNWGKVEEIKADAKETERLNNLIYTILAKNVGKPDKYFIDLVHARGHADWFLTSEEAKEHNVCNVVGLPKFKVQLKVDISFGV